MADLDRRHFIRRSLQLALTASAAGSLPLLELLPVVAEAAPPAAELAVRRGGDFTKLVDQCLEALGGMGRFVTRGDVVVVKPNIGWDRTPELAANTHPLVVQGVVRHCLEAGAKQVKVFDRTCNDPRRCYVNSGIQAAVEGLKSDRAVIEHIDRRAYRELEIAGGVGLQRWEFYVPALEADSFINLPIAKHHSISGLTLGMKNLMGVIGGNRGVLHRRIEESLCDINLVVPSTLTLVDATRILIANGPVGGRLEDVRTPETLVASPDIVLADSFAASLFDLKPADVPTLAAAARRGLGSIDLAGARRV